MKKKRIMAIQEENIHCKGSTVFRTKEEEIGRKSKNRRIKIYFWGGRYNKREWNGIKRFGGL